MSASAVVTKLLISTVTSKKKSKMWLTAIMIPVAFLAVFGMMFDYIFVSKEKTDIWDVAIRELANEHHLTGTLEANTMKTLHYFYYDDMELEDKDWIKGFIWCYFVNEDKKRLMDHGEIMLQTRTYFFLTEEEQQMLLQYMDNTPAEYHGGRFPYPMAGKVTKQNTQPDQSGIQIEGKPHDNVIAVEDGQVVQANDSGEQGNYIVIKHGSGANAWYSYIGNLCFLAVHTGDQVTQGQIIAFQGVEQDGTLSDNPALQFQVWLDPSGNRKADPLDYVGRK